MTEINIDYLKEWEGKQETAQDDITLFPARALAAALDRDWEPKKGESLPAFWDWMYFLPTPKAKDTGKDGHPDKGGFLPPVPLPRRMWAAGDYELIAPLEIGKSATRVSTIESVELKQGASGTLVFVNVRHDTYQNDQKCISQVQNIVYREQVSGPSQLPPGKPSPNDAQFQQDVLITPVLLFRYSALTYNGHRIHYDRDYTRNEEFYPDLIVHGPLLVTLLLNLQHSVLPERTIRHFSFRAMRPTFDRETFSIAGKLDGDLLNLWSADHEAYQCMQIKAELCPVGE